MHRPGTRPFVATLLSLLLLLAWDAGNGDLWLARAIGGPTGFVWQDNFWLVTVMHRGGKALGWALLFGLLVAVRWPVGVLRRLGASERGQLVIGALVSVVVVGLIKHASQTSCPWDLAEFGGHATHVSHWLWGVRDGGSGHCFPAGHASVGFAFVGGWFVLRRHDVRAARAWLLAALAFGLVLGVGQQLRGAHFLSHTLWSAWLCWVCGWATDIALAPARRRCGRPNATRPTQS